MGKRSSKTHRVPEVRQASLLEVGQSSSPHPVIERVRFDMGDRARLFVGAVPLEKYLEAEGLKWVLRLASLMEEVDWSAFEASYKPGQAAAASEDGGGPHHVRDDAQAVFVAAA